MKAILARVTQRGVLIVAALLGLLVASPSSLMTPLQAHASCYQRNFEDYKTWSGFSGYVWFSDDVYFTVYYNCYGAAESMHITGIYEVYSVSRNPPWGVTYTHDWRPTSLYSPSQGTYWSGGTKQCNNACTMTKYYSLNIWANPDYYTRVHTSINHCGVMPSPFYGCSFDHYIWQGYMTEWDY